MNTILGTRILARSLGLLAVGALVFVASLGGAKEQAHAQLGAGSYWLFQPHFGQVVGYAFCNAAHTVEYWAYAADDYEFASTENISTNRWHLDAEATSSVSYSTFTCFRDAVLAMPQFNGRRVIFQNHSMTEEIIDN